MSEEVLGVNVQLSVLSREENLQNKAAMVTFACRDHDIRRAFRVIFGMHLDDALIKIGPLAAWQEVISEIHKQLARAASAIERAHLERKYAESCQLTLFRERERK